MTMVWVTFMVGLGVLFGMAALVVDLGFAFVQVRAMQNGADAGVLAAAKLVAENVSAGPGGTVVFVISNGEVHQRAELFASYNRPAPAALSVPNPLEELLPRPAYAAPAAQVPAPTIGYTLAVEYRPCPTLTAGSPNFTFDSDPAIVAELGGTRQANSTDFVPDWTCALRVFARVTHASMFSSAIGNQSMIETSRATARIFPTTPPTEVSDVWPVTRWLCNGKDNPDTSPNPDEGSRLNDISSDNPDQCDDDELDTTGPLGTGGPDGIIDLPCPQNPDPPADPCTFWDSNTDPGTDWKNYVDFSRFSGLAKDQGIKRAQMLEGWADACDEVAPDYCAPAHQYDPAVTGSAAEAFPGNSDLGGGHNDKTNDVPYWIRHGWKGTIKVDPADCHNVVNQVFDTSGTPPSVVTDPSQCENSRLELFRGDLGANIATAMRDYIDLHLEGNSPSFCGFGGVNNSQNDYATVTVFVWRWGEQDTEQPDNHSIALSNQSKLWGYYQSNASDFGITNQPNNVKRIIAARAARFRFCRGLVEGARVKGYFVSWTNFDAAPVCPTEPCRPSPLGNTVALTD